MYQLLDILIILMINLYVKNYILIRIIVLYQVPISRQKIITTYKNATLLFYDGFSME